ncbi:MAG: DUF2304 domain-containing protein [Saprospiraceae bacterium]
MLYHIRGFQLFVPLLAVVFVISFISRYRKGKITLKELVFSISFWVGIVTLALIPDKISNLVAEVFGIKDNVNAVIFLSIGVLLYLQFMMYNLIKEQKRKLTELTRQLALRDHEKETK